MGYSLAQIGMLPILAEQLKPFKIRTAEGLLRQVTYCRGRKRIAEKTGIGESVLLFWANRADFARIKGLGAGYISLLQTVGVDTVKELKHRNPQNLLEAMAAKNRQSGRPLVKVLPSLANVTRWIEQANKLELKIEYR